ncbi:MAG: DNA/RNA nuclease SfsA [Ruminococcaceae bacterium]|nr:DNA/RNA nuclease SfsA [Oscillospiraceae bacterium]
MEYGQMLPGGFVSRPNRFIARVMIGEKEEICHVKNTGRCKELLFPGAQVWCRHDPNPARKTHYDLIAVQKGGRLINMDSQAPNEAAYRWLISGGLGAVEDVRREVTRGDSRFDLCFVREGKTCYLEVKGVTLEQDNVARFPDAPTQRGAKHLRGLIQAKQEGFGACVLFVIQMSGIHHFEPNSQTDPEFADTLRKAKAAGVEVMAVECGVEPGRIWITDHVPVVV